jgi:hypothetical protein
VTGCYCGVSAFLPFPALSIPMVLGYRKDRMELYVEVILVILECPYLITKYVSGWRGRLQLMNSIGQMVKYRTMSDTLVQAR